MNQLLCVCKIVIIELYRVLILCACCVYYHGILCHPATSTPLLKDLHNHVTPYHAVHWKVIGTKLGLPSETLRIIKYDNKDKAEPCCDAVMEKWLEVDPSATWEKVFEAIKSLTSEGEHINVSC